MKFSSHSVRTVQSLAGLWDFAFLGDICLDAFDPESVCFREKAMVPSAFDALPPYEGKRGAAAYRTAFPVPPGKRLRLDFDAVSMWSRVYVNGILRKENRCGYAPFSVLAEPSRSGICDIVVLADNRFDFERVPMHEAYFDFYQYGGIIREPRAQFLPECGPFIASVHVTPDPAGYREGWVAVDVRLAGSTEPPAGALTFSFDGAEPRPLPAAANGGQTVRLRVPEPGLWSPDNPALHVLRVALADGVGRECDDLSVRFGLRRIEARDGELLLNGEKLVLRGYNRHEWHPNSGPSTPAVQMMNDLLLLREMGCNFVRGSHYQQSQQFLDLCDELGILVWEESLGWGQRDARTFESARWREDHLEAVRAMVNVSFNHPSIIIWGFLNEAASSEDFTRPAYEETTALLRRLDPGRLVSYATNVCETDLHFDLVDLISINIYPGWYGCEEAEDPLGLIEPEIARYFDFLDEAGWRSKPVLVSEIGAEGLYGWREAHDDFFSEAYQARYLEKAARAILRHPRSSGLALWMFSDIRTYGGGRSLIRPRTFNNKGTFDEYRRPKEAFACVKRVFRGGTCDMPDVRRSLSREVLAGSPA